VSQVTTHVLDAANGRPAAGIPVTLFDAAGSAVAAGRTDADGRVGELGPEELPVGRYRLVFDTDAWFGDTPHFYPEITIDFALADAGSHYHVPVLLSPFAYSTYRGS
jgi:5-hydroxyisourate hydrolase